jgi:outer membrane receptor protein involved in Fe transport
VSYWDVATLAQLAWENPIVDATAGGRFEYHSAAGWSIVPRAALTKEVDWFHAKAMFSMAFRNPGTMNLALSPGLSPERSRVFEVELGAKIGRHLLFAVTGYDITIDDAIVFQPSTKPDGTLVETYRNIGRTGTCGLTSELRLRHPRVWANLGYSFYTAAGRNGGSPYEVPGREDVLLGFAPHKLTLNGSAKLTEHFVVSPSLVFLHERAGYTGLDADGNRAATLLDPVVLLDLFIEYRDAGLKGLDLGFGVYNLLDHDAPYVQPYDGGHAPLPGPSREFMGRVTWSYRFD